MLFDADDDVVSAGAWGDGEIVFGEAERFTELAFDAVSADCVSDGAADAQAQAVVWQVVWAGVEAERAAGFASACGIDSLKLSGVADSILASVGEARIIFGLCGSAHLRR